MALQSTTPQSVASEKLWKMRETKRYFMEELSRARAWRGHTVLQWMTDHACIEHNADWLETASYGIAS
jgi:hypothetical protein